MHLPDIVTTLLHLTLGGLGEWVNAQTELIKRFNMNEMIEEGKEIKGEKGTLNTPFPVSALAIGHPLRNENR